MNPDLSGFAEHRIREEQAANERCRTEITRLQGYNEKMEKALLKIQGNAFIYRGGQLSADDVFECASQALRTRRTHLTREASSV